MAQTVKNLPALQETRIRSLSQEDLLEKGMATHSSILAWRIPPTEEPCGLQPMESQRDRHDWVTREILCFVHWYISSCYTHSCVQHMKGCWQVFSSVQFSHSFVSDSLWAHGLRHTRPPCPSPTPRGYSNSRPSNWWCHPAISSSVVPFSSCPQSLPASEFFPMSQLFTWGGPKSPKLISSVMIVNPLWKVLN